MLAHLYSLQLFSLRPLLAWDGSILSALFRNHPLCCDGPDLSGHVIVRHASASVGGRRAATRSGKAGTTGARMRPGPSQLAVSARLPRPCQPALQSAFKLTPNMFTSGRRRLRHMRPRFAPSSQSSSSGMTDPPPRLSTPRLPSGGQRSRTPFCSPRRIRRAKTTLPFRTAALGTRMCPP